MLRSLLLIFEHSVRSYSCNFCRCRIPASFVAVDCFVLIVVSIPAAIPLSLPARMHFDYLLCHPNYVFFCIHKFILILSSSSRLCLCFCCCRCCCYCCCYCCSCYLYSCSQINCIVIMTITCNDMDVIYASLSPYLSSFDK